MQNTTRSMFIDSVKKTDTPELPETNNEKLREISMSRVSGPEEFDRLFTEVVARQQEQRAKEHKENKEEQNSVLKDDEFADIDKELGF